MRDLLWLTLVVALVMGWLIREGQRGVAGQGHWHALKDHGWEVQWDGQAPRGDKEMARHERLARILDDRIRAKH